MSFTLVFMINKVFFTTHSMLHSEELLDSEVEPEQRHDQSKSHELEQKLNPKVIQ